MVIYYVLLYLTMSYIVYIVNLEIFNDRNFVIYGLRWPIQVILLVVIYFSMNRFYPLNMLELLIPREFLKGHY